MDNKKLAYEIDGKTISCVTASESGDKEEVCLLFEDDSQILISADLISLEDPDLPDMNSL
jgi:hypothetical protein